MVKKVLFIIGSMELGGSRTSLIYLLNNLSTRADLKIDIFVMAHHGCLMKNIPSNVNIIPEYFMISSSLPQKQKRSIAANVYHIIFCCVKSIIGYRKSFKFVFKKSAKRLLKENGEYDAVFGYQEGVCNDFAYYVHAKKHNVWIHSDFEKWYHSSSFCKETYIEADKIVFVANASMDEFKKKFPAQEKYCIVIKNVIDDKMIIQKSQGSCKTLIKKEGFFRIISIGRVSEEKAFIRIVYVAQQLIKAGILFEWYILGSGPKLDELKKSIKNNMLSKYIILVGQTSNPYSYLASSDLLVVTSLRENQPMVILEALTLGVPVITTNYPSAREVIRNDMQGVICGNNEMDLSNAILSVLKKPSVLNYMKESLSKYKYDNDAIISKINTLY